METIHICTAADKNYKVPLTALLNSIHKNSVSHPCIIHILFDGLSTKYRHKLIKQYPDLSFDFIDMSKYVLDFHGLDMQHWTRAIFYRIMIPDIFKDLTRVLYIDGDTLVLQDLYDLFNTAIEDDKIMAMVVDRFSYKTRIPELRLTNYFNSGMILFDIQKCQKFGFSEKAITWIHNNPESAKFPDQDAINIVCDGKIKRVNNIYNKQFAPNDILSPDSTIVISHFLSAIKPWMNKASIKYSKTYRAYMPPFTHITTLAKQIAYNSKHFFYHEKYSMKLQKTKIIEQISYYVFNIRIWTKSLKNNNADLISVLQNNRDRLKCS